LYTVPGVSRKLIYHACVLPIGREPFIDLETGRGNWDKPQYIPDWSPAILR
jgi:hypothetical protein